MLASPKTGLNRIHEDRLFRRYRRDGEPEVRDELIKRHISLARALARRYSSDHGAPDEDLVQVACYGLVRAVDRFDPARGNRFTSLAVPTIVGELKRHFRDHGWGVHVPRSLQERVLRVAGATDELSTTLGRSPTPGELARHLDTPVDAVLEALEARSARQLDQLDAPSPDADDDYSVSDTLGAEDPAIGRVEDRAAAAHALSVLGPREREIIRLRFSEELTQAQIAERLGVSQMHVSRLLRRALDRVHTIASARSSVRRAA